VLAGGREAALQVNPVVAIADRCVECRELGSSTPYLIGAQQQPAPGNGGGGTLAFDRLGQRGVFSWPSA
jgi:hypothetical protein